MDIKKKIKANKTPPARTFFFFFFKYTDIERKKKKGETENLRGSRWVEVTSTFVNKK